MQALRSYSGLCTEKRGKRFVCAGMGRSTASGPRTRRPPPASYGEGRPARVGVLVLAPHELRMEGLHV
eukprot:scaffold1097_cov246-Pinguiococcus_pyrenoidosus.AAC.15